MGAIADLMREKLTAAFSPSRLDINDVMTSIRRTNRKYGYFANLEQQLVTDVGLFARASWNDRQNEILSFRGTNEIASLGR